MLNIENLEVRYHDLPVLRDLRLTIGEGEIVALIGFIYIILAESWNLLGGYTGLFNLGMAAFFGSGSLICHLLWQSGLPFGLAILAGGLSALLLAGIIGLPTLRLKGFYFAIGTLALAEALRILVGNLLPSRILMPAAYFSNFSLTPRYYLGLALVILSLALVYFIMQSKLGLALLAVREDEDAAKSLGVNLFLSKLLVTCLSALLAGFAGGLYAYFRLSVTPAEQFLPHWTFEPLLAAAIGGPGTISGPILGSLLLVIIQNWLALSVGDAHYIILGLLFILVTLFFPGGIIELLNRAFRRSGILWQRKD